MVLAKQLKIITASISLRALAATFELTSRFVPEMRAEISDWDNGRRVGIGVLPSGPAVTVALQNGQFTYQGAGLRDAHISILFKNLDAAIMIFTGQLAAHTAVAENRVCVHGNNYHAMQVTRAMAIAQTYLFPDLILRKTFKKPPQLTPSQLARKGFILGLLTPIMAKNELI